MKKMLIGGLVAIIVVAVVILGGYFVLNRQAQRKAQENLLPSSEVEKILAKDLDTKYPETPTEVVKLYWRINCCMYNEELSDKHFDALLEKIRMLYDDEFLAEEKNSFENMKKKFKEDKEKRQDAGQNISSYVVQKNDTVEVKKVDGRDNATVAASALIKAKGDTAKTYEKFLCRRSEDGKWKILGWQQINKEAALEVGVE